MRKILTLIHRIALILGVLVALTPCNLCQKGMTKSSSTCSMGHMTGMMNCCHKAKSHSPYCQIMDQSSVSVSSTHIVNPVIEVVSIKMPAMRLAQAGLVTLVVPASSSPPRGPLALRI